MAKTFLQSEWRKLVIVNYAVDRSILAPYLPPKTELDLWNDACYVSLVGFLFLNTNLKGFSIPKDPTLQLKKVERFSNRTLF